MLCKKEKEEETTKIVNSVIKKTATKSNP